jgi:sigma-B regulation protein RsbU (phosphoserine phosphatase)
LIAAQDAAAAAQTALSQQNASLRTNIKRAVGDKRRAERGLQEEQEMGELREQFVAVLGHDLRNPLASISAAARILFREQTSEHASQVLKLMEGSVRRMSGLIDNVLDFARGRLGGGIGLNRTTDEPIEPILRQVVEELKAGSPQRQIEVEFDIITPVFCDPGRIGQLLSNLLGNALSQGAIDRPVTVRATSTSKDGLTLSVSNAGEPIPQEAMGRLFEPFVRGHERGYQQGLGLDLHIAAEIAKAHGATLTVLSSTEATTFTMMMPHYDLSQRPGEEYL